MDFGRPFDFGGFFQIEEAHFQMLFLIFRFNIWDSRESKIQLK